MSATLNQALKFGVFFGMIFFVDPGNFPSAAAIACGQLVMLQLALSIATFKLDDCFAHRVTFFSWDHGPGPFLPLNRSKVLSPAKPKTNEETV
jgi:hypothetical protein